MAAKPKPMSQIKQILRLYQQGKSIKFIVRNLSVSRNTVRKYLSLQKASSRSIEELLQIEDEQLGQILMPGGETSPAERYQVLVDHYDYFRGELSRKGVTRWLLWSEYRQNHPGGFCYSHFCKHLQELDQARNLTMANLSHPPGEQIYIDFAGKYAEYVNPVTGEVDQVRVLLLTLGHGHYSYVEAVGDHKGEDVVCAVLRGLGVIGVRAEVCGEVLLVPRPLCTPRPGSYSYVQAMRSQKREDVVSAVQRGLRFSGGVSKVFVPDNMKTAVVKTDRYEPGINRLFEDLANHYHTAVLPARGGIASEPIIFLRK